MYGVGATRARRRDEFLRVQVALGWRRRPKGDCIVGEPYDDLVDEFIDAVKRRFGERCVVQFEDFSNTNGKRLLERYATQAAVFNGTALGFPKSGDTLFYL